MKLFKIIKDFLKKMVGVAQLVEPRFVVPVVAGSSPVPHPSFLRFYEITRKIYSQRTLCTFFLFIINCCISFIY